jgi:hypothetical protein
LAAY